ncbi:DEAD/DEAH box helicase [Rhodohalobacter sp. 614A]|uniref:DEAD/DEAH box helicase n=1 Tax=Rhodohalobacter sp. 614A TaxID=2908649 RepID=UPI001F3483DF|nr:DEAD/DEAH box helicase [Rhodohalobacter sp. 614A]
MKFTDFNLTESIQAGLRDIRFEEPTPIQEKSIPLIVEGKDVIGLAQTGTGKTGAFVIPIMQRVLQSERKGVKALILSPTRELAKQIDEQIFAIGYHAGITSATVIGGSDFSEQAKALKAGVDIIVATPGRLIDQNKVVNIDFSNLEYFVLDEADRMLDMGFLPDMKKIISWLPQNRQTLLFSATMPKEIEGLASSIMKNPQTIETERAKPSQKVEQRAYFLKSHQKIPLVKGIFDQLEWDSCIIFTSTKKGTDELQRLLKKEGLKAASIHGDRSQEERNKALAAFKNKQVPIIVATDVLARGIDIKEVSIIINYDVPNNTDDYVHRIGRTARYDKSGIAVTFITQRDRRTFNDIDNIKDNSIKKVNVPGFFKDPGHFSWEKHFEKPKKQEKKDSSDSSSDESNRDTLPPRPKRLGGPGKESSDDKSSDQKNKSQETQQKQTQESQEKKTQEPKQKSSQQSRQKKQEKSKGQQKRGSDQKPTEKKQEPRSKQKRQDEGNKQESKAKPKQEQPEKEKKKPINLPPVLEKAVDRNKRVRKPAKGVWGIIKSFIPKIRNN